MSKTTVLYAAAGFLAALSAVVLTGCKSQEGNMAQVGVASIQLTSPDFKGGEMIPERFTADGENISPALEWSGVPNGTKSFALIVEDPDAPSGLFVHWVLYNIDQDRRELPAGIPRSRKLDDGSMQGTNTADKVGYMGPAPPKGDGAHRYFFKLYALNKELDLEPGATREQLMQAMENHVISQGELMGKYKRE